VIIVDMISAVVQPHTKWRNDKAISSEYSGPVRGLHSISAGSKIGPAANLNLTEPSAMARRYGESNIHS
jgi:hypothetical protein